MAAKDFHGKWTLRRIFLEEFFCGMVYGQNSSKHDMFTSSKRNSSKREISVYEQDNSKSIPS